MAMGSSLDANWLSSTWIDKWNNLLLVGGECYFMAVHGNFGMLRKYLEGGTVYPQKRGLGNVAGSVGLVVLSMSCKCLCWLRFMCVHVCEQRMQEH